MCVIIWNFSYICENANTMNTLDIKTNFHHLIDQINDEQLLIKLYHIMEQASSTTDGQLWSKLTEEQQNELLQIEKEVQSGVPLISNDQMKVKHKKWLDGRTPKKVIIVPNKIVNIVL